MVKINDKIDLYIAGFPSGTQELLNQLRTAIWGAAPEAEELISYQMPAFKIYGRILVYFAGYKKHIGFYPGGSAIELFKQVFSAYKCSKGTIQFPLDQPLPLESIVQIVLFRVHENLEKKKTKK
jgi:uncharacterized protein YdhG (YjbR/CyaY superfamily)